MAAAICLLLSMVLFACYGFDINDLPFGLVQQSLLGFGLFFVATALLIAHWPESWRK